MTACDRGGWSCDASCMDVEGVKLGYPEHSTSLSIP